MRDRLRHRGPDGTGLRQNDGGGPGFAHIRLAVIRSQPRRRPVIPSRPSPMLHEETGAPSADVSVIIPAYRAAATIGRALASVAAQTMRPKEAIVVDDGSDDGTAEAAQAAASIMAGIPLKVLTQPHGGAGAARNRALCEASGTYVAFLDADDEWLSEKLRRSMEHLEGTDNILVAHDGWFVGDDGETLIACAQRFREERDPFVTLYRKGYIATCSVVARRDAVLAEGFDESLPNAQDFELWLAMLREPGTRFLVFDDPLVRYHPSKSGITSHTGRRLTCSLEIARRYAPELRRHPGSALASLGFRVLAIHVEAFRAYRSLGNLTGMLRTVLVLPHNLIFAAASLLGRPGSRPVTRPLGTR